MAKVRGKAVRVKKREGESTKERLRKLGLFDERRAITGSGGHVYIPVREGSVPREYEIVEIELEKREKRKNFRQLLVEKMGKEFAEGILSSYDVVGDIAIVQLPKGMEEKGEEIGKMLLQAEPRVRVVLRKAGGREGEFRITKLAHIAGEKRAETEYVENGVRMRLDIAKVYFSPRLSNERKRLAGETRDGENVLVLFAGVGPFALEIGKAHPPCKVAGVELNPDAVHFFKENIKLNKLGNVEAVLGDARELVKKRFAGWADRVAMPLPMGAEEFLGSAFLAAKRGGVVHFYVMVEKEGGLEKAKKRILEAAEKEGRKIEFLLEKEVRPYSASTVQYVIDFRAL